MDAKLTVASSAYADALSRAAEAARNPAAGIAGAAVGKGPSFSELLSEVTESAADTMRRSEAAGMKTLAAEASLTDVVTAVTSAEVTLRTVVAVRDRLIQAYQEIIKMPI